MVDQPMDEKQELNTVLTDTAFDISVVDPDPRSWHRWIVQLLRVLERKVVSVLTDEYEAMLGDLQKAIQKRLEKGHW
jgi:hypothetical protein